MTNPLSSYTTTFRKEPGNIQQLHGAFAVDEPFSCIDGETREGGLITCTQARRFDPEEIFYDFPKVVSRQTGG